MYDSTLAAVPFRPHHIPGRLMAAWAVAPYVAPSSSSPVPVTVIRPSALVGAVSGGAPSGTTGVQQTG
ncbi:hypothetical protein GCM10010295_51880 [Streptomyces intermedius]